MFKYNDIVKIRTLVNCLKITIIKQFVVSYINHGYYETIMFKNNLSFFQTI